MRITIPLPDARLHAHAKGHWRGKAAATKAQRERAYVEALAAGVEPMDRGRLSIHVRYPDLRRRDSLNTVSGLKGAIDGLVDAGCLPDDDWQHLEIGSITAELDRENPGVDLILEKI